MKNIITLLLFFFISMAFAQVGSVDTTFNPLDSGFGNGDGLDAGVSDIQYQPDGKMIVTGSFTTYNGTTKKRIVRLNPDGSIDNTFLMGTGFNSIVSACRLLSDGKILVAGDFGSYNSEPVSKIIRLNSNGTLDPTFSATTVGNASLITVQDDGKILIGGNFQVVNDVARNYFARLNANGSLDTSFDIGIGFSNHVITSIVQADGKIICGGAFTSFNGVSANRIVRLNSNGTIDTGFIYGSGFNNTVNDFKIQSDSKILVCGYFISYNGNAHRRLVRLNTDGSVDASFGAGLATDQFIRSMLLQDDGKIVLAGDFMTFDLTNINRIARINSNGTLDTSFSVGTGANDEVNVVEKSASGKIMLGGSFTYYKGIAKGKIIAINEDGSIDNTFNPGSGSNGVVWTICPLTDGKIVMGGDFTSCNGVFNKFIAKLNNDGTLDTSFSSGAGANSSVYGIAESGGKYIVGGLFTSYNGTPTNFITKLNSDGSIDPTFNTGTGPNSGIYALTKQIDSKIIIVGVFTSFNGVARNRIARLNNDGSLDTTFTIGAGANNTIEAVAIQPDGKILIGGNFSSYNGVSKMRIARLNTDGTLDTSFNCTIGGAVYSISLQNDGKVLLAGTFTSINSSPAPKVARLNADGSLDTSFNIGTGPNSVTVRTVLATPSGKAIVGGYFTSFSGGTQQYMVQLNNDGSIDAAFQNNTGADNVVFSFALQNDGKLLMGGNFTAYDQIGRNRIVRIHTDESMLDASDYKSQNISIYPNPATDFINFSKEISLLEVFSIEGKKMKIPYTSDSADLDALPSGIYIVKGIEDNGKSFTRKIIKN